MGTKASGIKVTYRNIRELKPYKKNAKKHPKEQVERIANSIKEFGFTQPVIIDTNNCVVAGHGRILGAKKAGLKQVPTVMLEDLTEEQIKAYRLVDNKLNESEWDYIELDKELKLLQDDIDMSLFGFELEEEMKEFEEKFKPKKTTDDCYTPDNVYNVVLNWCIEHYDEINDKTEILRPFRPGGDYESEIYTNDCVVVDNPPFSILSEICKFYCKHGIRFFLFAPTLTLFRNNDTYNYVIGNEVLYHNGALVNTSFITNMGNSKIVVDCELTKQLGKCNSENSNSKHLKNNQFPCQFLSSTRLLKLAKRGVSFKIKFLKDITFVRKVGNTSVYGSGYLMSTRCTNALLKAEQKAEQKAKQKAEVKLSESDKKIIKQMDAISTKQNK